jgi:hypothetical protein
VEECANPVISLKAGAGQINAQNIVWYGDVVQVPVSTYTGGPGGSSNSQYENTCGFTMTFTAKQKDDTDAIVELPAGITYDAVNHIIVLSKCPDGPVVHGADSDCESAVPAAASYTIVLQASVSGATNTDIEFPVNLINPCSTLD